MSTCFVITGKCSFCFPPFDLAFASLPFGCFSLGTLPFSTLSFCFEPGNIVSTIRALHCCAASPSTSVRFVGTNSGALRRVSRKEGRGGGGGFTFPLVHSALGVHTIHLHVGHG